MRFCELENDWFGEVTFLRAPRADERRAAPESLLAHRPEPRYYERQLAEPCVPQGRRAHLFLVGLTLGALIEWVIS